MLLGELPDLPSWLSHTATAMFAFGGGLVPLLLKWKKQTSDEWRSITDAQAGRNAALEVRIASLEAKVEAMHVENMDCLRAQVAQQLRIAQLEAQLRATKPPGAAPGQQP